ncbi:glycosyltransferase 87 family protein [Flavobacteriaceae bacterium 3-367]|uniref:glycosyltransferase 87 family protein n=1 Tax=Eudoraea algarum TaxID=3417568 RepID=UPI00327F4ED2
MPSIYQHLILYWKLHKIPILIVLVSSAFYLAFAYDLQRTDFIKLLTLFLGAFFLSFKLIQFEKWNLKFLLCAGILFRICFIIAEPNLSQDFYRFIWDGELVRHGINPYLHLPNTLIEQEGLVIANAQELYDGMGSLSAKHFSNYPPLNQVLFALAALLSGKSVLGATIALRGIIILADLGILYFGRKLLQNLSRSPHLIFWYFLNPLVIIELTGNLHFEGVMLFFFVWSMYLVSKNKWALAAVVFALSISVKLVPLLFLPLFLKHLGFKRSVLFYLIVGTTTLVSLIPFYSTEFLDNYSETVGLWFSNFEFNAGLYNLVKQIAVQFDAKPWELIKVYGKITTLLTITLVLLFTFLRKNQQLSTLMGSMLWVLCCYYFLTATVHPWYIVFVLLLALFTDYRFPLVWSGAVILSYWAYSNSAYKESLPLLALEYIVVYAFLLYEIFRLRGQNMLFRKN